MIRKLEYFRNQELEYMNILDVGDEVDELEGENGLRSEDIDVGIDGMEEERRRIEAIED